MPTKIAGNANKWVDTRPASDNVFSIAMQRVKFLSWSIIAILLLHGSGALSIVHKLSHHAGTGPVAGVHLCDHDDAGHAPVRDDAPPPEQDDEDCSICLGLAGLHLALEIDPVGVEGATRMIERRLLLHRLAPTRDVLGDCPARAPPVL
jgi:hypothetical protein